MNEQQIAQLNSLDIDVLSIRHGTRAVGKAPAQTGWWYILGWIDPKSPSGTMPSGLFLGETWDDAIAKLRKWSN